MALSPYNYDQILKVYALAAKMGCQFSCKPVENLKYYTNARRPLRLSYTVRQLCELRNQCFKLADLMYRQGDYKKARFYQDIPFYLAEERPSTCSVFNECLTIMPQGGCFFCIKEPPLGNALKGIGRMRQEARVPCRSCMLLCGAYKDYTELPFKKGVANIEAVNCCNLNCDICTQKGLKAQAPLSMSVLDFQRLILAHPEISHVSFIGASLS